MKINWNIIAIGALGGLLVFDRATNDPAAEMKAYWEDPNFRTDTVALNIDYTKIALPEFKYEVPPAKVYRYYNMDTTVLNNIYVTSNDSLLNVIDSLTGVVTEINTNYLKLFPRANKLIYGAFSADTIHLDLLNIYGTVDRFVYPVDFARFNYQYRDNNFRANSLPSRSGRAFRSASLLMGGGLSLVPLAPTLVLDFSTPIARKLYLGINSSVLIQTQPVMNLRIGVRYKVKSWGGND